MTALLLLVIAGLLVSVALYFRVRQAESAAAARQAVLTEEFEKAEAALTSAMERVRELERTLAARVQRPGGRSPSMALPARRDWSDRAVRLAAAGRTAAQIARELEVPAAEVELVLALRAS